MKNFKLFDDVETPQRKLTLPDDSPSVKSESINNNKWDNYTSQQESKQRANALVKNISKGILSGSDPYVLLLRAIECISLLTNDKSYYSQSVKQMKLVNKTEDGSVTLELPPPEFELPEVRKRLKALQQCNLQDISADKSKWIIQAINLHKEREAYLLKQIKSGG